MNTAKDEKSKQKHAKKIDKILKNRKTLGQRLGKGAAIGGGIGAGLGAGTGAAVGKVFDGANY